MKWFGAIAALVALLLAGTYWYATSTSATARVLVSFVRPTGTTGTLLLAMREVEKQWVVTQAGKDLTY